MVVSRNEKGGLSGVPGGCPVFFFLKYKEVHDVLQLPCATFCK